MAYLDSDGREIGNPSAFQITRKCFRHLCTRGSLAAVQDIQYRNLVSSWLETNASMMIRGQPLHEWSRASFNLHPSAPDFIFVPEKPQPEHFAVFLEALRDFFERGSRLFVTDTGEVGRLEGVEVNQWDKVCWIRGSKSSYLLRGIDGARGHTLVGPVQIQKSYVSTPPTRYAEDRELRDEDWRELKRRGYWTEETELV